MNRLIEKMALALAFGLGCVAAARGEHSRPLPAAFPLERLGDQLACEADELRDLFREAFRDSNLYGDLRRAAAKLERSGRAIRNQADSRRAECRIRDDWEEASSLLWELRSLVEEARFRGARGLDPALCPQSWRVDHRLARIDGILCQIQAELVGHFGFAVPTNGSPSFHDPGVYSGVPAGSRPGMQWERYPTPTLAPRDAPGTLRYRQDDDIRRAPDIDPRQLPGLGVSPRTGAFVGAAQPARGVELTPQGVRFQIGGMSFHVNR